MNEKYITIPMEEYKALIQKDMQYQFLKKIILDSSDIDSNGEIDTSYKLDSHLHAFFSLNEEASYTMWKQEKERLKALANQE